MDLEATDALDYVACTQQREDSRSLWWGRLTFCSGKKNGMPFADWHTMRGKLSILHPTASSCLACSGVSDSCCGALSAAGTTAELASVWLSTAGSSRGTTKSSSKG